MDRNFWMDCWQSNQIAFHQEAVHPLLKAHWQQIEAKSGSTVFVPLCGKSLDMLWLAEQGFRVLGTELSEVAVKAFFSENNLAYHVVEKENTTVYVSDQITIFCGDFFDLTSDMLADVTRVYDRGSLVALPPILRERYVEKLVQLMPPATQSLLISFEYPAENMSGPPFSVDEKTLRDLFAEQAELELLEEQVINIRELVVTEKAWKVLIK